jgi:hypothetical protein
MGFTLKSELEAHPRKRTHITCFGEAYLMDESEVKAIKKLWSAKQFVRGANELHLFKLLALRSNYESAGKKLHSRFVLR